MSKKSAGGRTTRSASGPCLRAKHDARMAKKDPHDVSFRAFRLACDDVLSQLERAHAVAAPARRGEIRLLRELFGFMIRQTFCGDSMIRDFS